MEVREKKVTPDKLDVSIEKLIEFLGFRFVARRTQDARIKCPFHIGQSDDSMLINFANNTFYCMGCGISGDIFDFVAKYEECDIKDVVIRLNRWFSSHKEDG